MIGAVVTSADQRRPAGGDTNPLPDNLSAPPKNSSGGCCGPGKKTRDEISVDDLCELAQSGDIILFDTRGTEQSWKYLMRSRFNHVGIVIETGYWPGSKWKKGKKCLMEAVCPTVMVDELHASLAYISHARYDEKSDDSLMQLLGYRRLVYPKEEFKVNEIKSKLEEMANSFDGRSYETNFGEIVESIAFQDSECNGACKAKKDRSEVEQEDRLQAVFCSELVAAIYMKCGLMDRANFANAYMPHDFSAASNAKAQNHMIPPMALAPNEVEVVGHSTDEVWHAEDLEVGRAKVRKSAPESRGCGVACCDVDESKVMKIELPQKFESNFERESATQPHLTIDGFTLKDPVVDVKANAPPAYEAEAIEGPGHAVSPVKESRDCFSSCF